jgi:hypothetical protein
MRLDALSNLSVRLGACNKVESLANTVRNQTLKRLFIRADSMAFVDGILVTDWLVSIAYYEALRR